LDQRDSISSDIMELFKRLISPSKSKKKKPLTWTEPQEEALHKLYLRLLRAVPRTQEDVVLDNAAEKDKKPFERLSALIRSIPLALKTDQARHLLEDKNKPNEEDDDEEEEDENEDEGDVKDDASAERQQERADHFYQTWDEYNGKLNEMAAKATQSTIIINDCKKHIAEFETSLQNLKDLKK
jgi:hypothetical protein